MANPFNELYSLMAEATVIEQSFFIAKVVKELPNLEVSLNDIVLDKDDLLVDKWIIDRNNSLKTENKGHSHGGDTIGDGEHLHDIIEPIKDILKVGDKVILLRIKDKFVVLSKVVSI